MTVTWIRDHWGLQDGNEMAGGDDTCTDGYSVRFLLADESGKVVPREHTDDGDPRHGPSGANKTEYLYSWVDLCFYGVARRDDDGEIALDPDGGTPIIWLQCRTETMVAAGPADLGDLGDYGALEERYCDYQYIDYDLFFETVEAAEAAAKREAQRYLDDYPYLIHRDICWDGLAAWERNRWPR